MFISKYNTEVASLDQYERNNVGYNEMAELNTLSVNEPIGFISQGEKSQQEYSM